MPCHRMAVTVRSSMLMTASVRQLALTVLATVILLVHTQPIGRVAAVAAERMLSTAELRQVRIQLVADAGAALFALLVATTLSVYKPWGMTPYARRHDGAVLRDDSIATGLSPWAPLWLLGIVIVVALFVALHLTGGG